MTGKWCVPLCRTTFKNLKIGNFKEDAHFPQKPRFEVGVRVIPAYLKLHNGSLGCSGRQDQNLNPGPLRLQSPKLFSAQPAFHWKHPGCLHLEMVPLKANSVVPHPSAPAS